MKILYVVNVLAGEHGVVAEPFVRSQIDSVRDAGHDVDVYNVQSNVSKVNYLRGIGGVSKMAREKSYDVVHGHYVYSGWLAALQNRAPSVVSFMGSDLMGAPRADGSLRAQGRLDIQLSRLLQQRVDGIIVKTQGMQSALVSPENSLVLPNGVDFNLFRPIPQEEARRQLGLDPHKRYVLFAGSYRNVNKGYALVEEAIRIARADIEIIELLLASNLPQDQVPVFMNAADALALASMKEGSPNVIKEAMACNLPVISTNVGDVSEVIEGVNQCCVIERTPEAFANAFVSLLAEPVRTSGRQAIEHLRKENVAQRLVGFYEGICV